MLRFGFLCLSVLGVQAEEPPSDALVLHGQNFQMGARSFADRVEDFHPGYGAWAPFRNPDLAVGSPNPDGLKFHATPESPLSHCALGYQGYLVLEFKNNRLIKSGDSSPDLQVFGSELKDMNVFVKKDPEDRWHQVLSPGTKTSRLDINDGLQFDIDGSKLQGDSFRFVKLQNSMGQKPEKNEKPDIHGMIDPYVGPFIDGIGAISSGPAPQNESPPAGSDPVYYDTKDFNPDSTGAGVEMFALKKLGEKDFLEAVNPVPSKKLGVQDNVVSGFNKLADRVKAARDELVGGLGTKVNNMMTNAKGNMMGKQISGDDAEAKGGDAKKGDDKKKTAKASMLQV